MPCATAPKEAASIGGLLAIGPCDVIRQHLERAQFRNSRACRLKENAPPGERGIFQVGGRFKPIERIVYTNFMSQVQVGAQRQSVARVARVRRSKPYRGRRYS